VDPLNTQEYDPFERSAV